MSNKNVAIALYRPHPGKEQELYAIVREHGPALKREGLITEHPMLQLEAEDGTVIEIFEWKSEEAKKQAHISPDIWPIWERMMAVAEMTGLATLKEAGQPFPDFKRLEL
ncbi:antibiotic biosynthesis monooxygenase [Paenibacillus glycanilyticus]|uniref:antibiotic biosynthesis monooxygenase n=1 Tax=Paenibacillus glycanilyticus TaxID=126569 RepID=UPI00203CB054|nr:antibiotic biosynthesis monooxygenase [Paenibacillus glycanilyticus]MCM3629641.1 antibiotic biosynthesis monooxygenase [Paenibacillus glycanilyticus]